MQFSEEIIEIFDYMGEKLGIAIDWSSENVMPYLQELCGRYINWEIATSVVWIVIGVICLVLCIPLYKKTKASLEKHEKNWLYDGYIGWCIVFGLTLCVVIPLIITQVFDIVKCIYLPELQIYEYITRLIQNQ